MAGKQEWRFIQGVDKMYFFTCPKCGVWSAAPVEVERLARQRPGLSVFCCNGHSMVFLEGESEADKLRRERDQLVQRLAQKDDDIRHQRERAERGERQLSAARGQITRIKNRAAKGVCPCCNRHFTNLERHMHTKHPGYVTEPSADEHVH